MEKNQPFEYLFQKEFDGFKGKTGDAETTVLYCASVTKEMGSTKTQVHTCEKLLSRVGPLLSVRPFLSRDESGDICLSISTFWLYLANQIRNDTISTRNLQISLAISGGFLSIEMVIDTHPNHPRVVHRESQMTE